MYSCKGEKRGEKRKSQKEKVVLICMQAFITVCEYAKDRVRCFACAGDEWPARCGAGRDGALSPSSAYHALFTYLFICSFIWSTYAPRCVSHLRRTFAICPLLTLTHSHTPVRPGFIRRLGEALFTFGEEKDCLHGSFSLCTIFRISPRHCYYYYYYKA